MDQNPKNFMLRGIPENLYTEISDLASKESRSINKQMISLLQEAVNVRQARQFDLGRKQPSLNNQQAVSPSASPHKSLEDFEKRLSTLTYRELDTLLARLQGDSIGAIAKTQKLNPSSIRDRLSRAYRKLEISSQDKLDNSKMRLIEDEWLFQTTKALDQSTNPK